jgi:cell division protein FtsX
MDFFKQLFSSPKVDETVGVIRFKVWSDLWGQKARTIQTVLAIAIGAVAVGASLGASRMISDRLRQGWLNSSPSMISLEIDPPVDQTTLDSISQSRE